MKASRVLGLLFLLWTVLWVVIGGVLTFISIATWRSGQSVPAGHWIGSGYNAQVYSFGEYFGQLLVFLFVFFIVWLVGALALGIPSIILWRRN